ncbi:MAG: tRNA 2-thiouridine(34) synthase MnmA [bacterium]|nr:tRNA 2-thiouridine(34) synthase MnmA [bacterium]
MNKRVVVALSGGVDSSVASALLKKEGFEVIGVHLRCWTEGDHCTSVEDERMARAVASHLGIPFYVLDLVDEYQERVISYLIEGYEKGETPNPDVMCNREIKFGLLFEKAMDLGAEYLATGHYARIRNGRIAEAADRNKDQSYFLARVSPRVLARVLFPLGEYTKPQVRKLAKKFGLPTAERPDSQGLCFIGKLDFEEFLKSRIPAKKGRIIDTKGKLLGTHQGAFAYTIGQRRGIGLSGGPWFVVAKDVRKNLLVVSRDEKDLETSESEIRDIQWFSQALGELRVKVRYRQPGVRARFVGGMEGSGKLVFASAQRAVASGQIAAMYSDEELVGAGVFV